MARYEFGMSLEEFGECTPRMFKALCHRRIIRIKYERYAHAQTASMVYNTSDRRADDAPLVHPMDWVRDGEQVKQHEERKKIREFIYKVMVGVPPGTTIGKLRQVKKKALADIVNAKLMTWNEAERLFDSVWPTLKEKVDA
jgi:hypothetical protein